MFRVVLSVGGAAVWQVVKQGEGWFCEYDQQTYMAMVRRYVMLANCVDASGDCLLSVFNEQVGASVLPYTFLHLSALSRQHQCFFYTKF